MDARTPARGAAPGRLTIVGLGPGDLERLPGSHRALLEDPDRTVIVRTAHHPAAAQLAAAREVMFCDDLYDSSETFAGVYDHIVTRVVESLQRGSTVYAVPGSPLLGEFAVGSLLAAVPDAELVPSESFVDAALRHLGYDPFSRGLRILNAHELPDPLTLDTPTIIGHLDAPVVLADVSVALSRVLPEGAEVTVCANLGASDQVVVTVPVDRVPVDLAGFRTSLFVDTEPAGLFGLVGVQRRLRAECPWDQQQTHQSLTKHLVEEAYELIDAIAGLPPGDDEVDHVAYDAVEEELGDVLLQVLFHASIAAERGAFGIDDVASRLREKLVRRHPHVFGDVEVAGADGVAANWEAIKDEERGGSRSLMDGVPSGLPSLERAATVQSRAARVGFDWESAEGVMEALEAELRELRAALDGRGDPAHEMGDVLFTAVNLARHLGQDPDQGLRQASARFEQRFRAMEAEGPIDGLAAEEMDVRWRRAKGDGD